MVSIWARKQKNGRIERHEEARKDNWHLGFEKGHSVEFTASFLFQKKKKQAHVYGLVAIEARSDNLQPLNHASLPRAFFLVSSGYVAARETSPAKNLLLQKTKHFSMISSPALVETILCRNCDGEVCLCRFEVQLVCVII